MRLFVSNPNMVCFFRELCEMVKELFLTGLKLMSPIVLNLSCKNYRGSISSYFVLKYLKLIHPTYY